MHKENGLSTSILRNTVAHFVRTNHVRGGARIVCVALLASTALSQSNAKIFPGPQYPQGGTWMCAAADLNGDGRAEILRPAGSTSLGQLLVFRNYGDGTLAPAVSYSLDACPANSLAVGDFNGDGKLDVVVANGYPTIQAKSVSMLLGDGAGGFAPAYNYPMLISPDSIAVGDFNHDGKLDVVIASSSMNKVSVMFGDGNGHLGSEMSTSTGNYPIAIAVGDWNSDGWSDLAVANQFSNNIAVYLNNGQGALGAPTFLAVGQQPHSIATGDWNMDGKPDLAVANIMSNDLSLFFGTGQGTFSAPVSVITGLSPYFVAACDLDGDGKPDMVVANREEDKITTFLGNGQGGFAAPQKSPGCGLPIWVTTGDLDGDGKLDVALACYGNDYLPTLFGDGHGGFGVAPTYDVAATTRSIAAGDLNGDGRQDLVVVDLPLNSVSVLLGDSHGYAAPTTVSMGTEPLALALSDLDGDGHLDLLTGNYESSDLTVRLGDGNGGFGPITSYPSNTGVVSIAVGDLNLDGIPDVVAPNDSNGPVTVFLGDGRGGFGAPIVNIHPLNEYPVAAVIGDFNEDGIPDVAIANNLSDYNPPHDVAVMFGVGNGRFSSASYVSLGAGSGSQSPRARSIAVGDLNGDHHLDLVVGCDFAHAFFVLLGDGHGAFSVHVYGISGWARSVAISDINLDLKPDIVFLDFSLQVWFGDGSGSFGTPMGYTLPGGTAYGAELVARDLNNDGAIDVAVALTPNRVGVFTNSLPAPCIALPYGQALPNSTGFPAAISASGSPSIAANQFVLSASSLPPSTNGLFFFGTQSIEPGVPFGNGLRFVGGTIVRTNVLHSDASGNVSKPIHFGLAPFDVLVPGDIRYFQYWLRDAASGGAAFNASNALEVHFCP